MCWSISSVASKKMSALTVRRSAGALRPVREYRLPQHRPVNRHALGETFNCMNRYGQVQSMVAFESFPGAHAANLFFLNLSLLLSSINLRSPEDIVAVGFPYWLK